MTLPRRTKTMFAAIALTGALTTAACGSDAEDAGPSGSDSSSAPAAEETTSEATESEASGAYAAGDYSAEGSYQTPGGTQSVVVDLTLDAEGTVTAVEVQPQADGGNSAQFQKKFAGGIADEVVGVPIDDLKVSEVSGSSLTSGGFNAAIDEIKAEAAA